MPTLSGHGWPFIGTWSSSVSYSRGDVVLRSGVLYQAVSDVKGTDPLPVGPQWADVSGVVMALTGSIDPTAGSGIPVAIGTTYQHAGAGLYVKTDTGGTDWTSATAGGGGGSGDIADPTDIANCALWFDASQLVLADDAPVATWPDLSGNGYDATQSDADSRPVCKTAVQNGLRVVRFDSQGATVPQWLDLTGTALAMLNGLDGTTVGVVASVLGQNQVFAALTDSGNARRLYFSAQGVPPPGVAAITDVSVGASNDDGTDADAVLNYEAGANAPTTVVFAAVAPVKMASLECTVIVSSGQFDGASGGSGVRSGTGGAFPNTNASAIHIGGANTEPGPAILDGDLMELAVFSRTLNAKERRQLLEYLSAKWAVL